MSRQPRILFLTLLNDVGSDRIVSAMTGQGAACAVLGTRNAFAARSRFVDKLFELSRFGGYWWNSLTLASRLEAITASWTPDMIVPLDDLAARILRDARFVTRPGLKPLIERSLGAESGFELACSRYRLVNAARALGIPTPRQEAVDTIDGAKRAAVAIGYPVVLKREQTCGGFGVQIVTNERDLVRAFKTASLKAKAKAMLGWIPGFRTASLGSLVLQDYIAGPLGFHIVSCFEGTVLDGVSFLAERTHPAGTGASTVLRHIDRSDVEAQAATLAAALSCSGLVSFDFILPPDGEAVLIEMNPRPVVSGHLGQRFGHDIYKALLDRIREAPKPPCPAPRTREPIEAPSQSIALFPRELDRDPQGQWLDHADCLYHDLPSDDPDMVAIYAAWLERRHPDDRAALRRRLAPSMPPETLHLNDPVTTAPRFLRTLMDKYGPRLTRRPAS